MNEVTRLLNAIDAGSPQAAQELMPLVYDELRRLAAKKMAQEKPGQTLNATGLVHEAYARLVDQTTEQHFANRRHFYAAAAEAMRRILVENARRKARTKHGGGAKRIELAEQYLITGSGPDDIIALDDALAELAREDPAAAELVQLHVFSGLSIEEAGATLGLARATAYRHWSYGRAWLRCELAGEGGPGA